MKLSGILGEDFEGMALGDYAMRPQIMSDALVDLDDQPPPGVSGLGATVMHKPIVRKNNHDVKPWWNVLFGRSKTTVPKNTIPISGLGAVYPQTYNSYGGSSYLPLTSPQYSQQYYMNIASPYRYGTRNWWQWYATTYLPQYYNQQQIYSLIQQNPLYSTYGYPAGYNPYQYGTLPLTTVPYGGQYNSYTGQYSPYGYGYGQYGYPQGYGSYVYNQQGAYGAQQCAASGGYFDYTQQQCYPQQGNYGAQTGTPPNVVGQSVGQGVSALNAAGFAVWERLRDGISQGSPPATTATNRVVVDDQNGVISGQYIG